MPHLRLTVRGRAVFSVLGATVISVTVAAIILGGAAATAKSATSASANSAFTNSALTNSALTNSASTNSASTNSAPAAIGGDASAAGAAGSSAFAYVQVESGQSLWQLAESMAPGADPRDVIYEIVKLNQLSTPEVHPGQQLAIPLAYSH